MAKVFKSRPDAIQRMIGDAVAHLPKAGDTFVKLVEAKPADRPVLLERMHSIEETADADCWKLMKKVVATFITPFDREDIYTMVEALDDIIDVLDRASTLIVDFEYGSFDNAFVDSALAVQSMCQKAPEAVEYIKKPNKLEKTLGELSEADRTLSAKHRKLIRSALADGAEPIQAMRDVLVADLLAEAGDRIERFVRSLSVAAVKET